MNFKSTLAGFLAPIALLTGVALMVLRLQQLQGRLSLGVLLGCIAAAAVAWVALCFVLPKNRGLSGQRLTGSALLMLAGAALVALACALSLYSASQSGASSVALIIDVLGIFAGLSCCIIALAGFLRRPVPPLLRTVIYLFLLVQLIYCFRHWSTDPVITDYIFQQLALITVGFGLSDVANLAFGKGSRRRTALWCMAGVGMSAMAVCGQPLEMALFYTGLMLLTDGSLMHAVKSPNLPQ